jgi:iron(III) transport system permease protein
MLLAGNTAALVTGTLALALPAGVLGAVLLFRTDLPLRRFWRFLTVLTLFIPLPLFAAAWQAALDAAGWPLIGAPALQNLAAAVWVSAVGGLPWLVLIIGQGLAWVEPELEEDALTNARAWRVLWRVTLPRCRGAILAAALWVALQTAAEITVTDSLQVRTFAEEVYTQFVGGDPAALARAVAVAAPAVLLTWVICVRAAGYLDRNLPPLWARERPPVRFRLGRWRVPALVLVLLAGGLLAGVPLASLVWRTGLQGGPPRWSPQTAWRHLSAVARVRGVLVGESLAVAATSALLAAGWGLLLCWLAVGAGWFRAGVLGLMAAAWALPGPVVGIGLKETIGGLLDGTHSVWLAALLYYGPSPLPVVWVNFLRFFPFAVAILWPVVRLIPVELQEAARVDGATAVQGLRYVVLPLAAPALVRACVAVAALSLGEVSAGKLAETPGAPTFAHEIFTMMHYGTTNDLAALGLVLVAAVVLAGSVTAVVGRWLGKTFGPAGCLARA